MSKTVYSKNQSKHFMGNGLRQQYIFYFIWLYAIHMHLPITKGNFITLSSIIQHVVDLLLLRLINYRMYG